MIKITRQNIPLILKETSSRMEMELLLKGTNAIPRLVELRKILRVNLSLNELRSNSPETMILRLITPKTLKAKSSWIKKGNLSKDMSLTLKLAERKRTIKVNLSSKEEKRSLIMMLNEANKNFHLKQIILKTLKVKSNWISMGSLLRGMNVILRMVKLRKIIVGSLSSRESVSSLYHPKVVRQSTQKILKARLSIVTITNQFLDTSETLKETKRKIKMADL